MSQLVHVAQHGNPSALRPSTGVLDIAHNLAQKLLELPVVKTSSANIGHGLRNDVRYIRHFHRRATQSFQVDDSVSPEEVRPGTCIGPNLLFISAQFRSLFSRRRKLFKTRYLYHSNTNIFMSAYAKVNLLNYKGS